MRANGTKLMLFLLAAVLLLAAPAPAQVTTGTVSGTVVDTTGAVIPGATVSLINNATGVTREQEASELGGFLFDRVRPGTYTLRIGRSGFRTHEVSNLDVIIGKVTSVGSVALEVGTAVETIEVEVGAAPLVQSDSAQITGNYSSRVITEAMWGTFNVDVLAFLTPGVQPGLAFSNSNTATGSGTSFNDATNAGNDIGANGMRGRFTNFTLDGQDNNDISVGGPAFFVDSPDIIQEFQITTNQFNADQGRNLGASINIVTKSGTNDVHGSVYWFHGNDKNLAATPSDKARQCKQPGSEIKCEADKFIDNQAGFTLGGPIIKNKLFAFGAYQQIEQRFGSFIDPGPSALDLTATGIATLRAAGFDANATTLDSIVAQSGFALTGSSPACQVGRLAGTNPASLGATGIDPTGTFALFDLEQVGPAGGIVASAAGVEACSIGRDVGGEHTQPEFLLRLDWAGGKNSFGGKYLFQDFEIGPFDDGQLNGHTVGIPGRSQYADFYHTLQVTPRMVNEFRFNYGRIVSFFEGGTGTTVSDPFTNPINNFLLGGTFNNTGNSIGFPQGRIVNNFQFSDNWSFARGRHTLKAGVDLRRIRSSNDLQFFANGLGIVAFGLGPLFNSGGLTANSFDCNFGSGVGCGPADLEELLSNQLTEVDKDFAPFRFEVRHTHQFYYFQDDFRLRPNLTLNFGLRFEHSGQPVNRLRDEIFARESDPTTAFWDVTLPVDARVPPRLKDDDNNWAPRIGFAWTPRVLTGLFGQDKTVIRGGYGIAYDVGFENPVNNFATGAPRIFFQDFFPAPPLPANPTGAGLNSDPNFAPNFGVLDPRQFEPILFSGQIPDVDDADFYNPYVQSWSLGMQREIGPTVAEVRYVGTRSVGLITFHERNPAFTGLANGVLVDLDGDGIAATQLGPFPGAVPAGLSPDPSTGLLIPTYGRIPHLCNCARSEYHGLQTRWDFRNLFNQLTGGLGWTWSKNIDNQSEIFDQGSFGGGTFNDQQNPFDLFGSERSRSNLDLRSYFTFYYVWDLPLRRDQVGTLGKLLGGWELAGSTFLFSGRPFTVFESTGNTICRELVEASGQDDCRPFLFNPDAPRNSVGVISGTDAGSFTFTDARTGATVTDPTVFRYIQNNDAAVAFFGTPFGAPRNTETGDGTVFFNLNILKNTYANIGERRVNFQFRTSFVNLFNHRNFGIPRTFVTSSDFADEGENDNVGRIVRFGLRIVF